MTSKIDKPFLFHTFCAMISLAYVWGVVCIWHYLPSYGLYIGLFVSAILCVALALFFLTYRIQQISYSTLLWWGLGLLVAVQPWWFDTPYPDHLLFASCGLVLMGFLSLSINQLDDNQRQRAVHWLAWALLLAGVLTVASQLVQVLNIKALLGWLVFKPNGNRIVSNVAQVNQAAFVSAMAMASVVYIGHYYQKINAGRWLVLAGVMVWLGMGLGFSASRAGLILALVAILSSVLYQVNIKRRFLPVFAFLMCVAIGYQLGTALMNHYLKTDTSAVGRMMGENSLHLRTSLLEQAKLAFMQNPLLGNGFDTMNHFGLQHAEQIHWFTAANHTHNIIAQMMAEFGILGLVILLVFAWLILRNFRLSLPNHLALAYGVLAVIALYSLSEYPLWYVKYLFVAVFFVAILDTGRLRLPNISYPSAMVATALLVGCVFYIHHYKAYQHMAYVVRNAKIPQKEKIQNYQKLPDIFGYKKYKELDWFLIMPIAKDKVGLMEQAKLGERVLSQFLSASMMVKQAQIWVKLGEQDKADALYRATCIFGSSTFCQVAIDDLQQKSAQEPEVYQPYLDRLALWYAHRFGKPMPASGAPATSQIVTNTNSNKQSR